MYECIHKTFSIGFQSRSKEVDYNPAGTCRKNDAVVTSIRRDDVVSTSIRRHFGNICPLGTIVVYIRLFSPFLRAAIIAILMHLKYHIICKFDISGLFHCY